ncbi:MAG: putative type transport system involved in Fe cluster assembly, permease and ATPase [Ramlibacter sp.]|nr:putative type transport system involved in Fe cluster assembly, permease and ATPase [Ramlibacter sp.]
MRRGGELSSPPIPAPAAQAGVPPARRTDWATLRRLLPYLLEYKWRVAAALAFMVAAKVANVSVPLLLKQLIDAMDIKVGEPAALPASPWRPSATCMRCRCASTWSGRPAA